MTTTTTTTHPIDFSSLPQDEQQQLQQLQLQFKEHQQQQQKAAAEAAQQQAQQIHNQQYHHHHDYADASQPYDPSQVQSVYDPSLVQATYDPSQIQGYDQSYYATSYYPYQDPNQVQNPQLEQYQHHHYGYYQPDYTNLYQQPPFAHIHHPAVHEQPLSHPPPQPVLQQFPQPESGSIHLPAPVQAHPVQQQQFPQPEPGSIHLPAPVQAHPVQQQYSQPEPAAVNQPAPVQSQQVQQQYPHSKPVAIHQPTPAQAVEQSLHVAGMPSVGLGLGLGQVQVHHQKNAYHPQQVVPSGDHNTRPPSVPQGLNPAAAAAIAALSQLTQFAGTMDAAERAMVGLHERQWNGQAGSGYLGHFMEPMRSPQVGRSPFRGRGVGRNGSFRGGGKGPLFHGRGRGHSRGGHRQGSGSSSSQQEVQPTAADVAESSEEEPELPANSQVGPSSLARCDTCNVDCNSLEMLEKHNEGKRHKKNLQRLEELKSASKSNPEVPEISHEGVEKCLEVAESTKTVTVDGESKKMRQGMKHNMRGGGFGGEKRMRMFDGPVRRQNEPHKPKVVIPLICELCNVKCDTREVFNCHLSGKKHITKLKRFEDHQTLYGPSGLEALYPPNPISQNYAQGQPQAYHGPQGYPHNAPPPAQNNFPLQFGSRNSAHGPR